MKLSKPLDAQQILIDAFRALKPFDPKGRIVNELEYYASEVVVSAAQRLKRGHSRDAGSVERLLAKLS